MNKYGKPHRSGSQRDRVLWSGACHDIITGPLGMRICSARRRRRRHPRPRRRRLRPSAPEIRV